MWSKHLLIAAAAGICLVAAPGKAAAHDEPVKGSLIGAGIGAIVGGPPGAAVGALIGAGIGSHVAHETDHPHNGHRHHSRARIVHEHRAPVVRERVVHVAPARYVERSSYANGNAVPCEPRVVYYKPRVVHRDDRVKVSQAVAKPKTKRVCKDVPVRTADRNASWIPSGG